MPSVVDLSHEQKLANHMWSSAYEQDGFRYYRCQYHGYTNKSALVAPDNSCEQCWFIFYMHLAEFLPTEELKQRFLDKGVQAVSDAAQVERAGKFDYQPHERPDIQITLTDDTDT